MNIYKHINTRPSSYFNGLYTPFGSPVGGQKRLSKSSFKEDLEGLFFLLPLAFCLLVSCGKDRTYEYEEKTVGCHQMQDLMAEWYLWGDSIKDLDWQQYFAKPTDFISKLTAQSKANDKWSYCLIDTIESDPLPCGYYDHVNSYGLDVVLMNDPTGETTKQYARVVTVYENSPAARCGLQRNDFISQVDNNKMASTVIKNLVNGRSHTLYVSRLGVNDEGDSFSWTDHDTVTLEKSERVTVPTVMVCRMVSQGVGYVMLTDLGHSDEITAAIRSLAGQGMNDLIIDVRLCNSGTIECVCEVARLISKEEGTFLRTFWNLRKSEYNQTYTISGGADYDLYFITSNYTQGAAEWLIHGLRSISEDDVVTVVGKTTAGQNVMLKAIPSDYQYTIYPAVAYVGDMDGNYNYGSGIEPDVALEEFDYAVLYPYGDRREVLLNYILTNR